MWLLMCNKVSECVCVCECVSVCVCLHVMNIVMYHSKKHGLCIVCNECRLIVLHQL